MPICERPDLGADPLDLFIRLRPSGFRAVLHSPNGPGWSYLLRTGRPHEDLTLLTRDDRRSPLAAEPPSVAGPPFRSGSLLLLSYEYGAASERVVASPGMIAPFPAVVVVPVIEHLAFEHKTRRWWHVWEEMRTEIPFVEAPVARYRIGAWQEHVSRSDYEAMVRRARDYIAAGDIFQVNLARWWSASFDGDPFGLFERLARGNPSPYAAYMELPQIFETPPTTVVSSSPELLFSLEENRIVTRPIAGTYPKSRPRDELPLDPKERAEHVMLIDLERNDLGRIAVPGSVTVEELFGVEEYSHLYHIVSQVAAVVRPGIALDEIVRAVFPGGTITGAPKIRAMQIIAELEPFRRGLYTGAIGLVNRSGGAVFNIAIRTALVQEGHIHLAAGAGIVADSDPAREALETEVKAGAFWS